MSKRKINFSLNKWKDYRLEVMKEAKLEVMAESIFDGDVKHVADLFTRFLIGDRKNAADDLKSFSGGLSDEWFDLKDLKNNPGEYNRLYNKLYTEIYGVIKKYIYLFGGR